MGVFPVRVARRRSSIAALAPAVLLALIAVTPARAADAMQWLTRVAQAARELNYIGTIVYQLGPRWKRRASRT